MSINCETAGSGLCDATAHGPKETTVDIPEADARLRRNIESVRREIEVACERAGRDPADVDLLAVTKYVDNDMVRRLHRSGLRDVGESTVQETLRKRAELEDLPDLRWHMIGHLQRNKLGKALGLYRSLHSLDSWRLAEALDRRLETGDEGLRLALFVEVNVGEEPSKGGLPVDEVMPFLRRIVNETDLRHDLAGLMTVAPLTESPVEARPYFQRLRELRDRAVDAGLLPPNAGLSMGMSQDFPVAVEEGATVVRVGSRLYAGISSS